MAAPKAKDKRITTGISLRPDVRDYLDWRGQTEDRSRSQLINTMVLALIPLDNRYQEHLARQNPPPEDTAG